MSGSPFELSEDDLLSLVSDGFLEEDTSDDEGAALQVLSRRISGQYVDVLAAFASHALAGRAPPTVRHQLVSAVEALERLAEASNDTALVVVLADVQGLLDLHDVRGAAGRRRFARAMQGWVLRMAELLDPADGQRLRDAVTVDHRAIPLLDELAGLRGIGPRRLERLYQAGLFRVQALSDADPVEVAQATGLPLALAADVVAASRRFAVDQRRRAAEELARRAVEVRQALAALHRDGARDPQLARMVREALQELQASVSLLRDVEAPTDPTT